jgi:hypothetical protein
MSLGCAGHVKTLEQGSLITEFENGHVYRVDSKRNIKFESVLFDNGADYYEEGLARFLENGKVGFHDESGNVVIKAQYDFATPFKDGRSSVCNGCYATYEHEARLVPLSSGACHRTLGDNHLIIKGGIWGEINLKGEVVVPLKSPSRM